MWVYIARRVRVSVFFARTGPEFNDPMDMQASQTRNDNRANYKWHKTMSQSKCRTDEDDQCDDYDEYDTTHDVYDHDDADQCNGDQGDEDDGRDANQNNDGSYDGGPGRRAAHNQRR